MGKYNVGYHGPGSGRDSEGIATLISSTIAVDNVKKKKRSKAAKARSNTKGEYPVGYSPYLHIMFLKRCQAACI